MKTNILFLITSALLLSSCDWRNSIYIENKLNDTLEVEYLAGDYAYGLIKNPKTYDSPGAIRQNENVHEAEYDSTSNFVRVVLPPGKLLHFADYFSFEYGEGKILNSHIRINIGDTLIIKDYELVNYFNRRRGTKVFFTLDNQSLSAENTSERRHVSFRDDTVMITIGRNKPKVKYEYIPGEYTLILTVYMFGKPYYKETFIRGEERAHVSLDRDGNIRFERYYKDSKTILIKDYYPNGQLKYLYDRENGIKKRFNRDGSEIE